MTKHNTQTTNIKSITVSTGYNYQSLQSIMYLVKQTYSQSYVFQKQIEQRLFDQFLWIVSQRVQIRFILVDNKFILCLSYNVKKSKISEKSSICKRHSNSCQGCYSLLPFVLHELDIKRLFFFFYIIGRIKQTNVRTRVNVYYRLRLAVLLTIKYFTAIKRLVIILLIILIKRRDAKMCDFNALTEHTLLLYFSGKTIKILVILIISRSSIDNLT